jgi:hypothetical protein
MIPGNISDVEKPQLAAETGDERLGLFATCAGPPSTIRKILFWLLHVKPPDKLGIDAAFLLAREPHIAARGDGRCQADAIPRAPGTGNGVAPSGTGAARIVIRAQMPAHQAACRKISSSFPHSRSCKSFWSSQVFPSVRISLSPRSADGRDDKRRSELCLHDLISRVAG